MSSKVVNKIKGYKTQDGAGVSLVRVLGRSTYDVYDPILLLDSFDSNNPKDYTAGFPLHPHRGIETISYIYKGKMKHRDSLGNEDTISDGEVQWMTAGSGIMHEETLPSSPRMLGVQLWLNLPAKYKMVPPFYKSIKNDEIKEIKLSNGKLRLLAGTYKEEKAYLSKYLPLDFYDIHLEKGASFTINPDKEASVMLFSLIGSFSISDEVIEEKTAVKLSNKGSITIKALDNIQVLFISSIRLDEEIAWGGPIVMNTKDELQQAFDDLRENNFLKQEIIY